MLFAGTDDATIIKITHENASNHFQFDPFASRPEEQCTAAALRAESTDVDTVTHVGRLARRTPRPVLQHSRQPQPEEAAHHLS